MFPCVDILVFQSLIDGQIGFSVVGAVQLEVLMDAEIPTLLVC